jgi:hypothetical protein
VFERIQKIFRKNKIRFFYRSCVLIDFLRGTDFYRARKTTAADVENYIPYSTAFYPGLLKQIFRVVPKEKVTGVLDFGSGKGLSLVKFHKYGIPKVGGVELKAELIEICKSNLKKYGIKPELLLHAEASTVKDFSGFNVIYMFNPFPCEVVKSVVENYFLFYKNSQMPLYILYVNPVCESMLLMSGFVLLKRFRHFSSHFEVSIFQHREGESY